MHDDFRSAQLPIVAKYDERLDCIAQDVVRHANDGRFLHRLQLVDSVFHLARTHAFAGRLDQIVFSREEVKMAVFILLEQITGLQHTFVRITAGLKVARCFLRFIPVAGHNMCAADDQLAGLPWRRNPLSVLILDPNLRIRYRNAD